MLLNDKMNDKVAIVTGGNGGLGQRICHALAQAGCHVAVVYAQSREQAVTVAEDLQRLYGVPARALQCDVSEPPSVDALMSGALRHFGRIDILVNDAAYNTWIPFNDLQALSIDAWQKILAINLTGPMLCCKAAAAAMRQAEQGQEQERRHIVNIASVAGLAPTGSSIAYAVSKAGLIHLTRCMAVALAPEIAVNCIAPGYLEDTRATRNLSPERRQQAVSGSLLKKPAEKDDIAAHVVALCRSDTITGQTLVIDSGRVFH